MEIPVQLLLQDISAFLGFYLNAKTLKFKRQVDFFLQPTLFHSHFIAKFSLLTNIIK